MAKIINFQESEKIFPVLKRRGVRTVLTGGCFDILHIGHVKFLTEAKKRADVLVVLLESDEKVTKLKGNNRPIFHQIERAQLLESLNCVDYIIKLPYLDKDQDYQKIIMKLQPDVIAVTENDPNMAKKKEMALIIRADFQTVPFIKTYSTSKLAKIIGID